MCAEEALMQVPIKSLVSNRCDDLLDHFDFAGLQRDACNEAGHRPRGGQLRLTALLKQPPRARVIRIWGAREALVCGQARILRTLVYRVLCVVCCIVV